MSGKTGLDQEKQTFFVYILHCENDTYYTGYTTDLAKRYASHLNGTGRCKYTRSFKPSSIAQCWRITGDKSLAMKIERDIKKLSRAEKERLVADPELLFKYGDVQTFDVSVFSKQDQ